MAAPVGLVKFWRPGTEGPGVSISEERQSLAENSATTVVYNPYAALSIEQQRQKLPVFKLRNHILYLIENYQTVVIVGETGCGKSTQIPQYLAEAGWTAEGRVVGVTQPRRVAAVTVAGRVAEERGAVLGHEVGYCIRFDDCTDPLATRIKFLTDGMLVREMMVDPLLTKYSAVMLDEAHERTLYTDIAIGLLKKIQKKRGDLRLIVASATLDAEKFRDFFNQNDTSDPTRDTCVILTVEGRTFPVDIFYLQSPVPDYIKSTVETVMKIHQTEGDGDILAFLTGQEEVETVVSMLIEQARALGRTGMKRHLRVLPMYAGLPSFEQMKVFERVSRSVRKVIVATNVAETSITISGIVYVIDCGFVKLRAYNPRTAIECLVVVPVSQASANQRAGRAGRSRSGKCYRLYTEDAFDQLPQSTVPEMQRSNLAPVILQLKALGIDNVLRFHFMSPPPAQSMVQALELLYALGGTPVSYYVFSYLFIILVELY
uniref:RNA helicase n=1 Tax=Sus scrofa TaxID=9823 RepID=A0A480ZMW4_PIG